MIKENTEILDPAVAEQPEPEAPAGDEALTAVNQAVVKEKRKRLIFHGKPQDAGKPFKKQKGFSVKKLILLVIIAAAAAGAGYGVYRLFFYEKPVEIIDGTTVRDSITTVIEGSAVTAPTSFQMLTIPVDGTVDEVFVKQGDIVKVGDPLYTIDTESVEKDIAELESTIADYETQLEDAYENAGNLSVTAPFSGKLLDVGVNEGDTVNAGAKLATLVDDSRMLLTLYFSYAYENDITSGMSVDVSIPDYMTTLTGTVKSIDKVSYVTAEGTKCFKVNIVVDNPGSLKEGTQASAVIGASGTELHPADSGTLEYYKTATISAEVSGKVSSLNMEDYEWVSAGEVIVSLDNDDYSNQIKSLEKKIASAELDLLDLQESLDDCSATAEVAGTVIFVRVEPGDEVKSGSSSMAVYNTDSMQITANINEIENEYIALGMEVTITKSGASSDETYKGTVTGVSLEGTSSDGVSYFPTTITIDSGGALSSGVYVSYSITAAQASDVVLAPIAAIKLTPAGTCLFVKADKRPENAVDAGEDVVPDGYYAVPVETGLTSNNFVEITSGVSEGVTVFLQYVSTGSSVSGSENTSENVNGSTFMPAGGGQRPPGGAFFSNDGGNAIVGPVG